MAGYYATYIMGKDAYIQGTLSNFGIVEKTKMKKLTLKQQLKNANLVAENLRTQMQEQNELLNRARFEGNQLIDKYNKLAGKYNAIRSLVTNDD